MIRTRKRQLRALQEHVDDLHALVPSEVISPGAVVHSPFVESAEPRRSLLPWRRNEVTRETALAVLDHQGVAVYTHSGSPIMEAVGSAISTDRPVAPRKGFLEDIPRGGATEANQGWTQIGGITDRRTLMEQLQMLYTSCSTASACVDVIARTCAAGGMDCVKKDESPESLQKTSYPPQVRKAMALFAYTNPQQNFRQLMRTIFTDLNLYGDSYIEVVWAFDEPIALYNLPCADMIVESDEHGTVKRYVQTTATKQKAYFGPNEVIHIKFDSPRGGLYGLGPTEKTVHSITTWLFTEGLLKAIMRRGNPPNVAFKWDLNLAEKQVQKFDSQYRTKNLGPDNVGNPVNLMGESDLHEFKPNQIAELIGTLDMTRDQICTGYGVPPAKLDIIETGSLGGGTGTSQDKTFKVNTCGPFQELVLEAFTYEILDQGFGIKDWRCKFEEIDWRDDEVIEKIRTQRVQFGAWTPNRYRDEVGEPGVEGGDDAVFVLSREVVPIRDIAAKSLAALGLDTASPLPTIGGSDKLVTAPQPGSDDGTKLAPAPTPAAAPAPKEPEDVIRSARKATIAAREAIEEMMVAAGMEIEE